MRSEAGEIKDSCPPLSDYGQGHVPAFNSFSDNLDTRRSFLLRQRRERSMRWPFCLALCARAEKDASVVSQRIALDTLYFSKRNCDVSVTRSGTNRAFTLLQTRNLRCAKASLRSMGGFCYDLSFPYKTCSSTLRQGTTPHSPLPLAKASCHERKAEWYVEISVTSYTSREWNVNPLLTLFGPLP